MKNKIIRNKYSKLIITMVCILSVPQTFPKPQAFYIETSHEGYIEANIRTPIEIKVHPTFPCATMQLRMRVVHNIGVYGNTNPFFENCENVSHQFEVSVPPDSNGSLIIDVQYENSGRKYSGSMSLRYTSIPPDKSSQNFRNSKQQGDSFQNPGKQGRENIKILPSE